MWEALNDFSDFVLSPAEEGGESTDESLEHDTDNKSAAEAEAEAEVEGSDDADDDRVATTAADAADEDDIGHEDEEGGGVFYMGGMGVGDFNDILFSNAEEGNYAEMTPETEAARRAELEETFTEPLLLTEDEDDDGIDRDGSLADDEAKNGRSVVANENSDKKNDTSGGDDSASNDDESVDEEDSMDEEEAEELKEIQQYLATFDIEERTDEISQLLSANSDDDTKTTTPTPLQAHFRTLVPQTVSYTAFWTRYYYRCDPRRISLRRERDSRRQELLESERREARERALREASDAARSIGRSAASFLKGGWSGATEAIAGVGDAVEEAAAGALGGVEGVVEEVRQAAAVLRVHQSTGRPPFVMGEMEDDEDSYYEEDDEGDNGFDNREGNEEGGKEGGLGGWSSDEYADDKVGEVIIGEEEEEGEEEVNFINESLLADNDGLDVVKLRQSLTHAEEERRVLMQKVEERNEEMSRLSSILEQSKPCSPSALGSGRDRIRDLKRESEWLRHLIAATSADDPCQYNSSSSALKSILVQMRTEIHCQKMKPGGESSIPASIKSSEATIRDLQSEIQTVKEDNMLRNDEQRKQDAFLQE